ncbi:ChaN family lipoprotein [Bdellovibrio sp. HCB2-146]|uniref:ChaN family lipoprotein n=1 Tax=Bdellovibrio sp. HCB2-146 TaxID=3394362 RepID=UPI0039BCBE1C
MAFRALFSFLLLFPGVSFAEENGIFKGDSLAPMGLVEAFQNIPQGSIVVLGENHGFKVHQTQHIAVLDTLRSLGHKVSVGLEFFTYTDQSLVEDYRAGRLSEADFLTAIRWGSPSYDFYRAQALYPNLGEGASTWALNAPRALTSKVAKTGLNSLSPEDAALLPPNFTLGRESYRQRFLGMMPHLPSPEAGERYFAAQSIWDDTMAWRAEQFVATHPGQTLVIVVGEFHVQYGGGLPDRLRARLPHTKVVTLSQINSYGLSATELQNEMRPSNEYGPRADLLWVAADKGPVQ